MTNWIPAGRSGPQLIPAGPLSILRYSLPGPAAQGLVRRTEKRDGLRVPGFRLGAAPLRLLLRRYRKEIEARIVESLRSDPPASLLHHLKSAIAPPSYRVLPWDGQDCIEIEARLYGNPKAPAPGLSAGGAARPGQDPGLVTPEPGAALGKPDAPELACAGALRVGSNTFGVGSAAGYCPLGQLMASLPGEVRQSLGLDRAGGLVPGAQPLPQPGMPGMSVATAGPLPREQAAGIIAVQASNPAATPATPASF